MIAVTPKTLNIARRIIHEMFQVKAGEVVAITADGGSNGEIAQAFFVASKELNAKPLVLYTQQARDMGQVGMPDWPSEALTAALKTVDVWIEIGAACLLYSDIWETVMQENKKVRYNILADSSIPSLERVFCYFDVAKLHAVLHNMAELAKTTKIVRVVTERGTDVQFETDANNLIDFDSGDFSKPKFCTAPGYLNLVPKSGTMRGKIRFDMIMHADLSQGGHVEFIMENGRISQFIGNESRVLQDFIESFAEQNMHKISHMMLGVCPGVQDLSWEIVEDERIWGGVNFGFGHTSPIDMPPLGQPANSHFDGVMEKATVWFDDQLIVDKGVFVHPSIADDAYKLLAEYQAKVRQA